MAIADTGEGGEGRSDQSVLNRSFERLGRDGADGRRSRERSRERGGDEADGAAEKTEFFGGAHPSPNPRGENPPLGHVSGDGGSLGGSEEGNGGNGGGDQSEEEVVVEEVTMERDEERLPVSTTVARLDDGVAASLMHEALLADTENKKKETVLRETAAALERLAHEENRSEVIDDETRILAERAREALVRREANRRKREAEAEAPTSAYRDGLGVRTMEFVIAGTSIHDVIAAGANGRADFANKLTEHTKADVSWAGSGISTKRGRGDDRDDGGEIFLLFEFRQKPEDRDVFLTSSRNPTSVYTEDFALEPLRLVIAAVNGRYGNTDTPARSVALRGKKRQPPSDRTGGTQITLTVFGGGYDYTTLRTVVEGHLRVGQPAALALNVAAVWDARDAAPSRRDGQRNQHTYVVRVTPLSNSPHDVKLRAMGVKVETPDGVGFALASCRGWECERCAETLKKLKETRWPTREERNTPFSHTEFHPEGECARAWSGPKRAEAARAERAAWTEARAIAAAGPEAGGVMEMEEGEVEADRAGGAGAERTASAAATPPGDWEVVRGRGRGGGGPRIGPLKARHFARTAAGGPAAPGGGPEGSPRGDGQGVGGGQEGEGCGGGGV